MHSTNLSARRLAVSAALVGALLSPLSASAQSQLDVAEAQAFMGKWLIAMQTDMGPLNLDLAIEDQGGKVAAIIGSTEMGGVQSVTDITRSDESLVLSFEADAQGQFFEVSVALKPDGDNLAVWLEVGTGEFSAGGVATRAEG